MKSPFAQASSRERKIKLFLWGGWGVGKTTLALQFPKPVLFDLDGGADLYGKKYSFDVIKSSNIVEIKNAIMWIAQNPRKYETIVIDPITVYWESLQKFWSDTFLRRIKGAQNKHEFFDLQPPQWNTIKQDMKGLFAKLNELNMNIVVTARETTKYKEGSYMKKEGIRPDCEKTTPYQFDTVLRLYRENGKYMALAEKDRTQSLPDQPFVADYNFIAEKFGLSKGEKNAEN